MTQRTHGKYFCPHCMCMRSAVLAEDEVDVGDPTPDLECTECNYVWGKSYKTRANAPTEIVPQLSVEDRKAGMERVKDDFKRALIERGLPLEHMTDPTLRIPRHRVGGDA